MSIKAHTVNINVIATCLDVKSRNDKPHSCEVKKQYYQKMKSETFPSPKWTMR